MEKAATAGNIHVIIGLLNTVSIEGLVQSILVGPVRIITDAVDLIQSVIGLIASERFDLTGQLLIGRINEFEKAVYRTALVFRNLEILTNIKNYHGGLFEQAIFKLAPVLPIDHTREIYFLHPGFTSLLAYRNRF